MLMRGEDTLSILVVEDDPMVAELLRTLVNEVPGWGAIVVHDGLAAQEVLRHVEVEAVVLDVNLPGISGLELLNRPADNPLWRRRPVILTSANTTQPGIQEALANGKISHFLPKPFDVDEVVEIIAESVYGSHPTQDTSPATPTGSRWRTAA